MTARAEKIVRQVEYYFSDVAFPFDAFMTAQSKEEGKGGFVDLSVIATFKKMVAIFADEQASSAAPNDSAEGEKISSAMPTADIVAAMAEAIAGGSAELVLNEAKTGVKRLRPIPSSDPDKHRTVLLSGLASGSTPEPIEAITTRLVAAGVSIAPEEGPDSCGRPGVVCLRNMADDLRPYDGTALVVLESAQALATAVAASPLTPGEVTVKSLETYFDELTKKRNGMQKKRGRDESAKKEEPFDENYPRGTVAIVKGLGDGVDREIIKAKLESLPYSPPAGDGNSEAGDNDSKTISVNWIEYERGGAEALVRFADTAMATACVAGLVKGEQAESSSSPETIQFAEGLGPCSAEVLSGDDERAYWVRKHESSVARQKQRGKKSRRGGGKGGGKRWHGGGGRR